MRLADRRHPRAPWAPRGEMARRDGRRAVALEPHTDPGPDRDPVARVAPAEGAVAGRPRVGVDEDDCDPTEPAWISQGHNPLAAGSEEPQSGHRPLLRAAGAEADERH